MPRSARINAIKSLRCYTLAEAGDVTGVSTRTISTWIKKGLPVMKDQRPHLIRGDDLKAFIRDRRRARKTKIALDQFYCLSCRDARDAAGGFAEHRIDGDRVMLRAICVACGNVMNKPVAMSRLPQLAGRLDLLETAGGGRAKSTAREAETGPILHLKR
ncbi:MAG: helix-turn-helix domain-containing protein [Pseudomonadota bacterium]